MGRCLRPHQPLLNSKLYSSARPQGKKRLQTKLPTMWAGPAIWIIYLGSKAQFVRRLLG
ncbi:hypothetical protein PVAP13_2KG347989 [Panicum virgatum]|uniref:Uncharacterized protein n=1 Tax=Panicum virgatum TaxID=38727 RepID=A0A8T0WCV1_PANVG|nr:hypothetical protein PVAP13_2KG347989 [Panicum virgatum]